MFHQFVPSEMVVSLFRYWLSLAIGLIVFKVDGRDISGIL